MPAKCYRAFPLISIGKSFLYTYKLYNFARKTTHKSGTRSHAQGSMELYSFGIACTFVCFVCVLPYSNWSSPSPRHCGVARDPITINEHIRRVSARSTNSNHSHLKYYIWWWCGALYIYSNQTQMFNELVLNWLMLVWFSIEENKIKR